MEEKCIKALGQISNKVESLTRFNKDTLDVLSCHTRISEGKISWRFNVNFSIDFDSGTGTMPYSAIPNDSKEQLNRSSIACREKAEADLTKKINKWLLRNKNNDNTLESNDCFDGSKTFGYQFTCSGCHGQGWNQCGNCSGKGSNKCSKCGVKGHLKCSKCTNIWGNSTGKVKEEICPRCSGRKVVTCHHCNGNGNIQCKPCSGSGRIECRTCNKTGLLHEIRTVKCAVNSDYNYLPTTKNENNVVTAKLRSYDLVGLKRLSEVNQNEPINESNGLLRTYHSRCIITELTIKLKENELHFTGFGSQATIFDFQKVATLLLNSDVGSLEETLRATNYTLWGDLSKLTSKVANVLCSEVNEKIDNHSFIREGIIDQAYASRVTAGLKTGFSKLLFSKFGTPFVMTFVVCSIIFVLDYISNLNSLLTTWKYIPYLLVPVLVWVYLEIDIRQKIANEINAKMDRELKISSLIDKYQVVWNLRLLILIPIIALVIAILFIPRLDNALFNF